MSQPKLTHSHFTSLNSPLSIQPLALRTLSEGPIEWKDMEIGLVATTSRIQFQEVLTRILLVNCRRRSSLDFNVGRIFSALFTKGLECMILFLNSFNSILAET